MSHGSLHDALNASGQVRWTASWIVSTPAPRLVIANGQVAGELVITCLPAAAVVPRVVEDPVVAGQRGGEDRRVVRERDRGQAGHRAVPVRGAHLDEARDVRRLARRGHLVEDVRVGAVEQEPDDVLRATAGEVEDVVAHDAVLDGEVATVVEGREPSSSAIVGATSTRRQLAVDEAVAAHALARDHERCPGLHDADRPVLAEVAALVLPVVGGRVDDAEVGGARRVVELGDLVEARTGRRCRRGGGACRPVRRRAG